jgi:hypothetical protein
MNRAKHETHLQGEDMLQWIIVGFLNIASFRLLAVLGGLAAAGDAFRRWAERGSSSANC